MTRIIAIVDSGLELKKYGDVFKLIMGGEVSEIGNNIMRLLDNKKVNIEIIVKKDNIHSMKGLRADYVFDLTHNHNNKEFLNVLRRIEGFKYEIV
ncbi:hypothetical protein [Paenibacillus odorifer]|uniref:hypothetical protein n=1 Tax=Paenibacillus odorifer TaxID=189426 RepID=UPI00096E5749|nr:hypothetical protein [Paenibacillus odorifer]OMD10709.1 hypothetical protein BJP50_28000 [Paenibacillus odorifer]